MNQSGGDISCQLVETKDNGAVNSFTYSGTEQTTENEMEL